jgi:hypothetical protein
MAKYLDKNGNVVDETGKVVQTASQYASAQKTAQQNGITLPTLKAYTGTTSSGSGSSSGSGGTTVPISGNSGQTIGGIKLTPEQIAKVQKNNPNLAKNLGLPEVSNMDSSLGDLDTGNKSLDGSGGADFELPDVPARKGSLVMFADALNQATELARKSRLRNQQGQLATAGFTPGNVSPGTFAAIIGNLERRESSFSAPLSESAVKAYQDSASNEVSTRASINELALSLVENGASREAVNGVLKAPNLESAISMAAGVLESKSSTNEEVRQVGNKIVMVDTKTGATRLVFDGGSGSGGTDSEELLSVSESARLGVPYGTTVGEAIQLGKTPTTGTGGGGGSTPSTKKISSGGLVITQADIGEGASALDAARGEDGYTDPNLYLDLYQDWVSSGGLPNDFIKYFPPEQYLNPAIDPKTLGRVVPDFILKKVKKGGGGDNVDALLDQYLQ